MAFGTMLLVTAVMGLVFGGAAVLGAALAQWLLERVFK